MNPKTYYNKSFTDYLRGSTNTSRSLKEGVDMDGATAVRVGFSNVKMTTVAGKTVSFGSASQVVKR